MTSKERVLLTVHHREPDRVPVGEFGIDHDHVSRILGRHTYHRNRKDTTLALWDGRRDEVVEGMKRDYADLIDTLGYDLITVDLVPPKGHDVADPPKQTGEGEWEDDSGNVYKYCPSNDSIQLMTHRDGKAALDDGDIERAYEAAGHFDESAFELLDFMRERYGDEKAIVFRNIDVYGSLLSPFGGDYTHQLILSLLAPGEIKRMYGPALAYNKKLIDYCKKKGVTIAMQGTDLAMNTGCIISPASIRDVYMPFMNIINDEIIKTGMVPFFHCCGRMWDILGDYADAGYAGYQSVQQSAGMVWKDVKELYGNRMTIWAGVQCETLTDGTLDETEAEVEQALCDLMPGGGFIFGSTNSVQFGAKTENYLKALEVVREKGVYGQAVNYL